MTSNKNNSNKKRLIRQLSEIAFLMLAGMTAYEAIKQNIFPNITIWQSHIVTIVFSTVCATAASFFILRRTIRLNSTLAVKIIESQQLQKELEDAVEHLKTTLSEVKTLTGLLPICTSCKKIRDDKGYWNQIELYIKEHSEADFSHSICPECAKKLYPEFYKENTHT
jgi:hypothetical protein